MQKVEQEVIIPRGISDGNAFRVQRMGHGAGDLLIRISVGEHEFFKREGYDIHTNKFITIGQAVFGGPIDVTTIYGKKTITIRPGTASDVIYKISHYGVQKLPPNDKFKGDHYAHIKVLIPGSLNNQQKEAMMAFAAVEPPVIEDKPINK